MVRSSWKSHVLIGRIAVSIVMAFSGSADEAPLVVPASGLDLNRLARIVIADDAHAMEQSAARTLAENFGRVYARPEVGAEAPPPGTPVLFLGRGAALAAGLLSEVELARVRHDGFVSRVDDGVAVVAGYAPQGTVYGAHRLLRMAGIRWYPWRDGPGSALEVVEPIAGGMLPAHETFETPFFAYRSLLNWLDRGRWGATLRGPGGLAEFRDIQDHPYFAGKGWLGADHTAPFLVPMARYRDEHPEYYALRGEQRLTADTPNARVTLCLSNPAVKRIAAERALDWVRETPDRRFFYISDGDADQCGCPACVAVDPFPGQSTDRYLQWVNAVAQGIQDEFPDITLLTLAYGSSVKPPRDTAPLSNVVVMYCPWFWNSRGTSATTWGHPFNLTAMREFTEWNTRFPGQIGVYDYPDIWPMGMARRLQFLAREGVRNYYSCEGRGDLLQWLGIQLMWDPLQNISDLTDEFMAAYYGPAADDMLALTDLKETYVRRHMFHRRNVFDVPDFVRDAEALLDAAEALADGAEALVARRILTSIYHERWEMIRRTHPLSGAPALRRDPERHERDVRRFAALARQISGMLGDPRHHAARAFNTEFTQRMKSLEIASAENGGEAEGESDNVFDHAIASVDGYARRIAAGITARPARDLAPRVLNLAEADEARRWHLDGSQPDLIEPGWLDVIKGADGSQRRGMAFRAPLSQLPEVEVNQVTMRAGRFFVEREFDEPWNIAGWRWINFHLVVTGGGAPATFYINGLRSDIDLQEGEQIVRVDLSLFRPNQFDFNTWNGDVTFLGIEIWPQDNHSPFDHARDVELMLLAVSADNHATPAPELLPDFGHVIWLSATEPNIPRGIAIPQTQRDALLQRQRYRHVGQDYGSRWRSPRFRTWTEHRVLSPMTAICVGPDATDGDRAAAEELQDALNTFFGVRLALRSLRGDDAERTGNRFYIGRSAVDAVQAHRRQDIAAAGARGFVIEASAGGIAIAGADEAATLAGVRRYLEDFGFLFPGDATVWDRREADPFLHPLFVVDQPFFENAPLSEAEFPDRRISGQSEINKCHDLASRIKDLAREGARRIPSEWEREAVGSPLTRDVINRLLWNPFDDVTALIRMYQQQYGIREETP